jgi:hypothetical protein
MHFFLSRRPGRTDFPHKACICVLLSAAFLSKPLHIARLVAILRFHSSVNYFNASPTNLSPHQGIMKTRFHQKQILLSFIQPGYVDNSNQPRLPGALSFAPPGLIPDQSHTPSPALRKG